MNLMIRSPNLTLQIMQQLSKTFPLMTHLKHQQIIIIQSVCFDDQLLQQLALSLPLTLQSLSLDFTGCQSLRGSGFVTLWQRISNMDQLRKLKLELGEVYDLNDVVVEGLVMLMDDLDRLESFYLDFYEVDQVTEQGYLLLAQGLTNLVNLQSLHLDFSANPNITQDNLELFFTNIPAQKLKNFAFRILDIDHIGGGSFFKLGQLLSKTKALQNLQLTISTLSNLNHKGTLSIIKQISHLSLLNSLQLNLSNTQLPPKLLSYLILAPTLTSLTLDISCNKSLTDSDLLSIIRNFKNLVAFSINVDFCYGVTDDSIEELIQVFFMNTKASKFQYKDRQMTEELARFIIRKASQVQQLISVNVNQIANTIQPEWKIFQQMLTQKRNTILAIKECQSQNKTNSQINSILSMLN